MKLKKGDTIGIIALSGDCEEEKVRKSKQYLESIGYDVHLSKNIFDNNRYLAGNDDTKISELHNFFLDDKIKLILCARGGYGSIRLVNKIDYDIIRNHPKPFCGFSDVTALLLMIYKKTGIPVYHAPMACTDFTGENFYTQDKFFRIINDENMMFQGDKIYKSGAVQGILWGGNLSTIVSLCGLDFIPREDFLFFTEDLNEPVYKIDKMFQQLINIETFLKYCKGIILGDFLNVDNSEWMEEYFAELATRLNIPISGGYKITHEDDKITIPIGKIGRLNEKELYIFSGGFS